MAGTTYDGLCVALRAVAPELSQVRVGEQLFHAARSCATCHDLEASRYGAGREPQRVPVADGTMRHRDVPALYDVARQIVWGWDGWFAEPVRMRLEDAVERCSANLDNAKHPAAPLVQSREERFQALAD